MNITLTREEAQQVLDALECVNEGAFNAEIKLLRARLAQPELKWLGLTDDEIRNEAKNHVFDESFFSGAIWARGQIMGKTMDENKPEVRSDIDQIYSAVMTDTEALEDAKMTLEVIKKTDPGVYDEMIDDTLSLIRRALSNSILGAIDRLADPDQEPVVWQSRMRPDWEENGWTPWKDCSKEYADNFWETPRLNGWLYEARALYTAPPQREDREAIALLVEKMGMEGYGTLAIAAAIRKGEM
jgi:hypothetical protein